MCLRAGEVHNHNATKAENKRQQTEMTTTFPETVQEAAKLAAGNWRRFGSFCWTGQSQCPYPDDWMIHGLAHRDSGCTERANAEVISKAMRKYERGGKYKRTVVPMQMSLYTHGWANELCVRVYSKSGRITAAFRRLFTLLQRLEFEVAVLDESVHSRIELEATYSNIQAIGWRHDKQLPEGWFEKVYDWLSHHEDREIEAAGDDGGYPSEEAVERAIAAKFPEYVLPCKTIVRKRKPR